MAYQGGQVPWYAIRVFFTETVYVDLNSPEDITASQLCQLVAAKVQLADWTSYRLYEYSGPGQEQIIAGMAPVFDLMDTWTGRQKLMFKKMAVEAPPRPSAPAPQKMTAAQRADNRMTRPIPAADLARLFPDQYDERQYASEFGQDELREQQVNRAPSKIAPPSIPTEIAQRKFTPAVVEEDPYDDYDDEYDDDDYEEELEPQPMVRKGSRGPPPSRRNQPPRTPAKARSGHGPAKRTPLIRELAGQTSTDSLGFHNTKDDGEDWFAKDPSAAAAASTPVGSRQNSTANLAKASGSRRERAGSRSKPTTQSRRVERKGSLPAPGAGTGSGTGSGRARRSSSSRTPSGSLAAKKPASDNRPRLPTPPRVPDPADDVDDNAPVVPLEPAKKEFKANSALGDIGAVKLKKTETKKEEKKVAKAKLKGAIGQIEGVSEAMGSLLATRSGGAGGDDDEEEVAEVLEGRAWREPSPEPKKPEKKKLATKEELGLEDDDKKKSKKDKRKSVKHTIDDEPLAPQRPKKTPFPASDKPNECPKCGKPVYFAEQIRAAKRNWHKNCFRCMRCDNKLQMGKNREKDGRPYCVACHGQLFGTAGYGYGGVFQTHTHVTPGT